MADRERLLIVGGGGFIGSHLARRALADGHETAILLRPASDAARLADVEAHLTICRVAPSDKPGLRGVFARVRPTRVFYLAGRTGSRHDAALTDARQASEGPADLLAVLEAAAEANEPPRKFVRTGTIAEYGAGPCPFDERQREQPVNGYALAAVAGTHLMTALAPHLPFPVVTARLSLVYGAGQPADFLVPSVIASCLDRLPVHLNRPLDGRDLLHVDDVVDALLALADADIPSGEIVNVGSGEAVTVLDIAERVTAITGSDRSLIRAKPQSDPVTHLLAIERMRALTGWSRRIGLGEGLASLVAQTRGTMLGAAA